MAPLATAFVRLRSDSSLLAAEATRDAALAGDKAGIAMGRSMSSGLTRTFKAVAGIGAATGLVEAGRKVLQLADTFEAARASAEQNTQNIGVAFKSIEKPIGDLDDKMAALGFTIADTEGAFSQLITATRDPAKAMRDVALAADIARGRHISLNEATQILMRVETGHVAMLGRLGIATRNANGSIFTQKQAIEALAGAYGGNASRFAETFAGKQAVARAEIQKSATEIGVALLPAMVDLANVISHDLLPPLVAVTNWFDRNKRTVEPLVAVIGGAAVAWKAYTTAIKLAAAANLAFGGSAVAAEAGAAGTAVAAGAAGRARLLGFGGALAGGAAIYAGSKVGGQTGAALNAGGIGAVGGSLFGPSGAAVGAAGGLSYQLTTNALHDFFGDPGKAKGGVQFSPAFQKQVDALGGLDKALAYYRQQNAATVTSQKTLTTAVNGTSGAVARTADQLIASAQKTLAVRSAEDGLREAFHRAAQTAADSGRALTGNSDAALANRDAVAQEANAIFGVIDAMKAHGVSAAAQTTALGILEQALEINATKTYGDKTAVDALLASLGLVPAAAQNAASALDTYMTAQISADAALDPRRIDALRVQDAKTKAAATASAKALAESFTAGYTPVVAKGAASAAAKAVKATAPAKLTMAQLGRELATSIADGFNGYSTQLDATVGKSATSMLNKLGVQLNVAAAKYRTDLQAQADLRSSVAGSVMGNAALSNVILSNTGGATLGGFLSGQIRQDSTFSRLLAQLRKRGLDPRLIQQLADAGPQQGGTLAQSILSGGQSTIRQVNAQERTLGKLSDSIGGTVANATYAGKVAKEQKALDKAAGALERLVTKKLDLSPHAAVVFERAMEQAIRKAMPSLNVKELDAALGLKISHAT